MTRTRRIAFLLVLASLLGLVFAAPTLATEETTEPTEATTETVPVVVTDIEPAVVITVPADAGVTPDWTYRYLIPAGIALIVLIILATTGQYFTSVVRKRYRIVEE